MTTLEKAWKPVLTSGRPFAADNPAGLAFLLARLDAKELLVLPQNAPCCGRSSIAGRRCGRASRQPSTASRNSNNVAPARGAGRRDRAARRRARDAAGRSGPVAGAHDRSIPAALAGVRSDLASARHARRGRDDAPWRASPGCCARTGIQQGVGSGVGVAAQPHGSAARRRRAEERQGARRALSEDPGVARMQRGRHIAPAMQGRFVRIVRPAPSEPCAWPKCRS